MGCQTSQIVSNEHEHLNPADEGAGKHVVTKDATEQPKEPEAPPPPPPPAAEEKPTAASLYVEHKLSAKETIDEQMALDQVNSSVEILAELHGMLCQQYETNFAELQQYHQDDNCYQLWKSAHSLKGAMCNLGINRFAEVCRLLEQFGQQLDAQQKAGNPITDDQRHSISIFIELMAQEWEVYCDYYAQFAERLAAKNKEEG